MDRVWTSSRVHSPGITTEHCVLSLLWALGGTLRLCTNGILTLTQVQRLRDELQRHLQDGRRGEIVREGVHIALVGPPNAGEFTESHRVKTAGHILSLLLAPVVWFVSFNELVVNLYVNVFELSCDVTLRLCLPFAGKSSLMNALARRPAAIVSPIAGTTRYSVCLRISKSG
jgi:hypothetical protein